jgi:calcineurin-like phosphoesterase family protein
MMFWFTADQHFNHEHILTKFVFRPFSCTAEMNAEIIRRHNERVKPGHTVFHLGDFKLSSQGPNTHELMGMLNGNHVFIRGNHDKNNGLNTPLKYCIIETYGQRIVLTHRPEDAEVFMAGGGIDLAFVGHIHEKWQFRHGMVNVGVDQWDFYPVDARQILRAYNKWRKNE